MNAKKMIMFAVENDDIIMKMENTSEKALFVGEIVGVLSFKSTTLSFNQKPKNTR